MSWYKISLYLNDRYTYIGGQQAKTPKEALSLFMEQEMHEGFTVVKVKEKGKYCVTKPLSGRCVFNFYNIELGN